MSDFQDQINDFYQHAKLNTQELLNEGIQNSNILVLTDYLMKQASQLTLSGEQKRILVVATIKHLIKDSIDKLSQAVDTLGETAGAAAEATADAVGAAAEATGDALAAAAEATSDAVSAAAEATGVTAAAEATGDALEAAAEATGDALQAAGESIVSAASAAGEAIEGAASATGEAVEDAYEEAVEQAAAGAAELKELYDLVDTKVESFIDQLYSLQPHLYTQAMQSKWQKFVAKVKRTFTCSCHC